MEQNDFQGFKDFFNGKVKSSFKEDEYFKALFNNVTDDEGYKVSLDEAERMVKEQIRQQLKSLPTFSEDLQRHINDELKKMQMQAMEFYEKHPEKLEEHRKMHQNNPEKCNSVWRKVDKAPEADA